MDGSPAQPRSVQAIDKDFRQAVRDYHRVRWWLIGCLLSLLILAVALLAFLLYSAESRLQASCSFYADLAPIPVTVSPQTHIPSELGVKIIADSRAAWEQEGCPGVLPPANPSLDYWSHYFHLPQPTAFEEFWP